MSRVVAFWIALGVGMASAIAAAVCFTAVYYEDQQSVSRLVHENPGQASAVASLAPTRAVVAIDAVGNTLPWWIAGAVCAALAVAFLTVAVLRRPRSA